MISFGSIFIAGHDSQWIFIFMIPIILHIVFKLISYTSTLWTGLIMSKCLFWKFEYFVILDVVHYNRLSFSGYSWTWPFSNIRFILSLLAALANERRAFTLESRLLVFSDWFWEEFSASVSSFFKSETFKLNYTVKVIQMKTISSEFNFIKDQ